MKKNKQGFKKMQKTIIVIKRILNILKKINHIEKVGDYDNDFYMKYINLLDELLQHEKSLCEKMCNDPSCEEIILEIIENPSKFQMAHNLKGVAFSRLFRNMFIYNKRYQDEANINILHVMPEFSHLEFRLLDFKYARLFQAFSEDLFNVYMRIFDKHINNVEDQKLKEKLIDEKYKIFATYANTNEMLVKHEEKESTVKSKMTQMANEEEIDERVQKFLIADFSYNLGAEFFENMLQWNDQELEDIEKKKKFQMRILLLDSVLVFSDHEIREQMENIFYKKHYEIKQTAEVNNEVIAQEVFQRFSRARAKEKILTI